jgi:hypothetical protein
MFSKNEKQYTVGKMLHTIRNYNLQKTLEVGTMRQKDTYSKEEYNLLKKERDSFAAEVAILNKKLEHANQIIGFLNQRNDRAGYEMIKTIIEEENNKQLIQKLFIKHPYYKEIKQYADMGIQDINEIALAVGKSYSSVRRALIEMDMYPIEKKDYSHLRLNI